MYSNFEIFYRDIIISKMNDLFKYDNVMQVPRIKKIVISMGSAKDSVQDSKSVEHAFEDLKMISGQLPVVTKAKKSIASFKLRKNQRIGCKVTLRKRKMYEFLERLIECALTRVRDFRGLSSKGFDGRGNYSFGLKEQIVFPEIDFDNVDKIRGLSINIITSTNNDEEARKLLMLFGLPFVL